MKQKFKIICVLIIIILSLFLPSYAEDIYIETETQTSFSLPENWIHSPLLETSDHINAKFKSNKEGNIIILYSNHDLWNELSLVAKIITNRKDMDISITKSTVAEMFGIRESKVRTENYNGNNYYKVEVLQSSDYNGINIPTSMTHLLHVNNGYIHTFSFGGTDDSEQYYDFERLLNTVNYSLSNKKLSTGFINKISIPGDPNNYILGTLIPNLIFSLIITISIYSLPIIIYRYFIRKRPVLKKESIIITISYGTVAFFIMSGFNSALGSGNVPKPLPLLVWGYINYSILNGGKDKSSTKVDKIKGQKINNSKLTNTDFNYELEDIDISNSEVVLDSIIKEDSIELPDLNNSKENDIELNNELENDDIINSKTISEDTEKIRNSDDNGIKFCHICGNKLIKNSLFCNKCGVKIPISEVTSNFHINLGLESSHSVAKQLERIFEKKE